MEIARSARVRNVCLELTGVVLSWIPQRKKAFQTSEDVCNIRRWVDYVYVLIFSMHDSSPMSVKVGQSNDLANERAMRYLG